MKVHLTRTTRFPEAELRRVCDLLARCIGPIEFVQTDRPILFERKNFSWDAFFYEMHLFRSERDIPDDEHLVCLTELSNELNWFSAFDPNGTKSIFVHGEDWEYFVYSEPKYPIAFEVVLNVLQRELFPDLQKLEGHPLIHDIPRGCINDMCINKTEIGLKMRTGDICLDCLEAYENTIGDRDVLKQTVEILEMLRRGMVNSRVYLTPLSFEEKLPFSVSITKRKMGMTSQPFRKFLMMIDHFDSLVRTAVIMLACLYHSSKEDIASFYEQNGLNIKPSLGSWVQALAKLSKMKVDSYAISLPPDFHLKLRNVIRLESERNIVFIRNEKRGHGYIECEDQGYENEYSEMLPVLEEIEEFLGPLFERFHYYYVRKTNHLDEGRYRITHVLLSGSNPAFLETESEITFELAKDIPKTNKCYLVTPEGKRWTCLEPYIRFGVCPECKHARMLVCDGEVYLDPFVGHRVELCA